jgi:hypothetical protein
MVELPPLIGIYCGVAVKVIDTGVGNGGISSAKLRVKAKQSIAREAKIRGLNFLRGGAYPLLKARVSPIPALVVVETTSI